jgi:hypothetical protein
MPQVNLSRLLMEKVVVLMPEGGCGGTLDELARES